jgi:hypothetical protein
MATMYALPALTTWAVAGGWSNTSGGASNGAFPSSTTDVVFDANSGPSRTISASGSCASITTAGANPMTFTGTLNASGTSIDLTGTVSVAGISIQNGIGTSPAGNATLKAQGVVFASMTVSCSLSLLSDLNVSTTFTLADVLDAGSTSIPYNFTDNGHNITVPAFVKGNGGNGGGQIGFSGVWTLTGAATPFGLFSMGNSSFVVSTGTLKFSNSSSTAKSSYLPSSNSINVVIEATGSGGISLSLNGSTVLSSFKVQAGCTVKFGTSTGSSFTLTAGSFAFNGAFGSPITLTASTTVQIGLIMTGGGKTYLDVCNYSWLNCSPANSFVARASTDGGNNTGITTYKAKPNLLAFF